MTIDEIAEVIESLGGVLTLRPGPGDGSPEISWGDAFFYYAPNGVLPPTQPFATIVTKNYPDEAGSGLDRPGAFRLNVAAGTAEFAARLGFEPRDLPDHPFDPTLENAVLPHPVYGSLGWLAVVNPGPGLEVTVVELVELAHGLARARHDRRGRGRPDQVIGLRTSSPPSTGRT